MGKTIGIDLGTTNSCVSVMEGGKSKVLNNAEGGRTTPSIVAFSKNGERLVGVTAKRQAITNPERTIYSIKRFMGRRFSEVQNEIKEVPYKVTENATGGVQVNIGDKTYSPQEISAMILQKLKADAESYLGDKVTDVVITVPAYFDNDQRKATSDAGKIAGMNVQRIINEPTAASLSYGLDKKIDQKIAVFDLGGGTFDISILHIGDGIFEVMSTNGDTHLGGDDFDQRVINWLVDKFKSDNGIDLSADSMALQRLKEASEKAKIELSSSTTTDINLPFITADASGPKHLNYTLTRSEFEKLVDDLVERTRGPVENALKDASSEKPLTYQDIDEVILVGGMTRMPKIQKIVKEIFKKDPHKGINPDEVVAMGAAIQAGVISGDVSDILLLDVTPLSLKIETLGGIATTMIERNSAIPTQRSEVFSTAADNQTEVEINVLQGESDIAARNKSLGKFRLTGIPPAPRGLPQVEVKFEIDRNGILKVTAKDNATNNEQSINIENSTRLEDEDIQRMINEAKNHEDEDKKKKEEIETRNNADSMAYEIEKQLKDVSEKLSPDVRDKVTEALKELQTSLKGDNIEDIKKKTDNLNQEWSKAAQELYAQQQQAGPQGQPQNEAQNAGQTAESSTEDDDEGPIQDADYEVVD